MAKLMLRDPNSDILVTSRNIEAEVSEAFKRDLSSINAAIVGVRLGAVIVEISCNFEGYGVADAFKKPNEIF